MAEEFVCNCCGGTFEKARPDTEALAEAAEVGHSPLPGEALEGTYLCDVCYGDFRYWFDKLPKDAAAAWVREVEPALTLRNSAPDSHSEDTASDTSRDQTPENS